MEFQYLLLAEDNGVLTVTINRPQALNALNLGVFAELKTVFTSIVERADIHGIIITGAGEKAFVAGADIKEFQHFTPQEARALAQNGHDILFLIENCPKPVIAAVNGFALGGGCELAMACHLRVAGEKAKFGQPEVNLGLIPGYGGTQRLTQLIGKAKSLELLMTADMLNAQEAHRLGLANHVVAAGEEVAFAKSILSKIGTKAPIAIAKVIECVNAYYATGENGFEREVSEFGATFGTEDFKEGTTAFVEKRPAQFKGK